MALPPYAGYGGLPDVRNRVGVLEGAFITLEDARVAENAVVAAIEARVTTAEAEIDSIVAGTSDDIDGGII